MSKKVKGLTAEFRPYIKWALGSNPFRKLVVSEESVTMERFEGADTTLRQPLDANAVQGFWKKRLNIGDIELSSTTGKKFTVANIRNVSHVVDLINNPSLLKEQFSDVAKVQPTKLDARANDNAPAVKPYNPKPDWSRGLTDADFSDRVVVIQDPMLYLQELSKPVYDEGARGVENASAIKTLFRGKEFNFYALSRKFFISKDSYNETLNRYPNGIPGMYCSKGDQISSFRQLFAPCDGIFYGVIDEYNEANDYDALQKLQHAAYGESQDFYGTGRARLKDKRNVYAFFRPLKGCDDNFVTQDFIRTMPKSFIDIIQNDEEASRIYNILQNKPLATVDLKALPKNLTGDARRRMNEYGLSLPKSSWTNVSDQFKLDAPEGP